VDTNNNNNTPLQNACLLSFFPLLVSFLSFSHTYCGGRVVLEAEKTRICVWQDNGYAEVVFYSLIVLFIWNE